MDAVYIHVPFCKKICTYCDFCKIYLNNKFVEPYLKALEREINDKYQNEEIKTIYIGGGTPSSLSINDLRKLLDLTKIFNTNNLIEFSFECNLNDITEDLLMLLKEYNVNRLSIGIESFNEKKLSFMNRNHTYEEAYDKINLCRKMGFDNINIDLIYGIPKETISILKKDVKQIVKLNPEHISTYSLIIEDNTVIGISKLTPIDEELDEEMYRTICNILKKNDYIHYEVSNFAKKGYSSRHNVNYWLNEKYYGFGLGAHGYIGNIRYENTRSITKYINGNYVLSQELLSKEEDMNNTIMLGFRLLRGINISYFYDKYQINLLEYNNIQKLIDENKLICEDGYIRINPKYMYLMNEILIQII